MKSIVVVMLCLVFSVNCRGIFEFDGQVYTAGPPLPCDHTCPPGFECYQPPAACLLPYVQCKFKAPACSPMPVQETGGTEEPATQDNTE